MKRTSTLRRRASYIFGLLAFASGVVAGVALADGLPPALGTSVALPTVSVSTPVATATVATPTVTAPAATTVALPAVTTSVAKPVATVTTPAVPAVPAKTVSVTTPAAPAKTVSVAVPATPTKTVSVTKPVSAAVPAQTVAAAVSSKAVSAPATPRVRLPVQPAAPSASLRVAPAAASAPPVAAATQAAAAPAAAVASVPLLQHAQDLASPLAPLGAAVSSHVPQGGVVAVEPLRGVGARSVDATTGGSVLVSPLASQIGIAPQPVTASVAELQPASPPATSTWSSLRAHPAAVTGGLLALTALAALGLAGVARSPATAAACADLLRFPFPRFRVLPCPGVGSTARGLVAGSPTPGSTGGGVAPAPAAAAPSRPHPSAGSGPLPGRQVVPRLGGVLGAGISTSHPWEVLKTVLLAMLAAANLVLLAVRWRLGRQQGS